MGNECKSCTQDDESMIAQSQQNIISQTNQYSFGINQIDNDINFEFSDINTPTVPHFGFEQNKIKVNFLPPQALRVASDEFILTQSDNEETVEQQINEDINYFGEFKRIPSQDENSKIYKLITKRNKFDSNLSTLSELQMKKQYQSQRSTQIQLQSACNSRIVNKELKQKQKQKSHSNSEIKFISKIYFVQKEAEEINPRKKRNDNLTQQKQRKNFSISQKKDEFVSKKIRSRKYLFQSDFHDRYD